MQEACYLTSPQADLSLWSCLSPPAFLLPSFSPSPPLLSPSLLPSFPPSYIPVPLCYMPLLSSFLHLALFPSLRRTGQLTISSLLCLPCLLPDSLRPGSSYFLDKWRDNKGVVQILQLPLQQCDSAVIGETAHRQYLNEWMWLRFNKTGFSKIGGNTLSLIYLLDHKPQTHSGFMIHSSA